MENNQITQQSSESNSSEPSLSRRWRNSTNSSFLVNLIKHRPWLLWIAVVAFLFTTIYLSLVSITQTGFVKNEQPKPTPVVTENPTTSQTDNSVFLGLLGVVIIGSGASAIAIAKLLPTLSQSHLQSISTIAFARRRQRKLLQSQQQMSFLSPVASEAAPSPIVSVPPPESQEQFQVEERILIVLDNQPLNLGESEAQLLTQEEILSFSEEEWLDIVASEDNNPIAAGTESLAEMLDLRKQLPLSTLLGENFQMLGKKK